MRFNRYAAALALVLTPGAGVAAPVAHFSEVAYRAAPQALAPQGEFSNPVMPGFQPDPSIVRVGGDFYLVNSTFAFFPGIPIYHSRDLVNWRLVTNAINRPGMLDFTGLGISRGVFAPTISYFGGKFRIVNTCVDCGGNFIISADKPDGPWSDPVWLGFEGIDPALFIDDNGSAWMINNGEPEGPVRYPGHRAIWIQKFDLATNKLFGPRKVLVDGGVVKADQPIWAEGPHIYKVDGWYYLMPAEGGTAENHSETIYRSRSPDGPYAAGPINPILTQRDLPRPRADRVEATGHADLVQLQDGSWWSVFLATRPFTEQSTLLGRETFLLPVTWQQGWPLILPRGKPVPLTAPRPNLPQDAPINLSTWTDRFTGAVLSPEWLRLRTPKQAQWAQLDRTRGGLDLTAQTDGAGSKGEVAFLGRRMRSQSAAYTATLRFTPVRAGDRAGLLAFADEEHFLGLTKTRNAKGQPVIAQFARRGKDTLACGSLLAEAPVPQRTGLVELRIAFDRGTARLAWRPAGRGKWIDVGGAIDAEFLASVHSGLFTGLVVGPYAETGACRGSS